MNPCSLPKTAVLFKNFLVFSPCRLIFTSSVRNMERKYWEQEKTYYLAMTGEQKRKNCVKWQTLPTWKEYCLSTEEKTLYPIIDALPDHNIDDSKNDELCNKVAVFHGDITTLEIDAIVNAANKTLLGGGGVDGAIHLAAGKNLKYECQTLGGCETGQAKITGAYKLPSRYVIHTVGPVGEKPSYLRSCYTNCMKLLTVNKLRTIAFPCISTGIYGYPNLNAAHESVHTIRKFLEENSHLIDRVVFCLFVDKDKVFYEGVLQSYFPVNR